MQACRHGRSSREMKLGTHHAHHHHGHHHHHKVCGHMKVRHVLLIGVAGVLTLWLITFYLFFSDPCQGYKYTVFLCDQYKKGVITGDLCSQICHSQKVTLSSCILEDTRYKTFKNGETLLRMNVHHLDYLIDPPHVSVSPYNQPEKGTSMEQFRGMVTDFVSSKLGEGDHTNLVFKVLDTADINKDAKISLAEAKTIWSLLQHNEFFILLVFGESEHVPNLQGFCGDLYGLDYHANTYLFRKSESVWLDWIFPNRHQWSFPDWNKRAKITVGLLEFAMEVYQHGSLGTFYMCNTDAGRIGYNNRYEMKLSDVSQLIPREELHEYMKDRTCQTEHHCAYSPHCTTICDPGTMHCTADIIKPNLYLICRVVEEYIQTGAPPHIESDLSGLLQRCFNLQANNTDIADVEHSLVLNDLKLLLWRQISDDNSSE